MAQIDDIRAAQDNLEETFSKRMAQLEAQLQTGGTSKETVAKVAEEFRTFRELVFSMLGLLRQQVEACSQAIDVMETRHRRKALLFLGIPEVEKEDCQASVLKTVSKMDLMKISTLHISACHRLGTPSNTQPRPLLVWFASDEVRSSVWRAKTKLKGTPVSIREFLTKTRQLIFTKARQHFGIRSCWTQDGLILVKTSDGSRHKISSMDVLKTLTMRYASAAAKSNAGNVGAANSSNKNQRKC